MGSSALIVVHSNHPKYTTSALTIVSPTEIFCLPCSSSNACSLSCRMNRSSCSSQTNLLTGWMSLLIHLRSKCLRHCQYGSFWLPKEGPAIILTLSCSVLSNILILPGGSGSAKGLWRHAQAEHYHDAGLVPQMHIWCDGDN